MAAAQVVGHIRGLHHDFANTQAHSEWLQRFQQAPEAWGVVHELLTNSNEEVVHYFASHTLVTKLQAGDLPTAGSLGQELMRYLSVFKRGSAAVRRQLVVALVDYALWRPAAEDDRWLTDCVQQLSATPDSLHCLLEFLAAIPEEAANRKVVVEAQRRQSFALSMLRHTATVLDALWKASQTNEVNAVIATRAFAKWVSLQHADPALRAQKKLSTSGAGGSGPYSADLLKRGNLHANPLIEQAAGIIGGIGGAQGAAPALELCRACGDLLSEVQMLTNETTPQARALLRLTVQAIVAGSKQLLPMVQANGNGAVNPDVWLAPESELVARLAVIGRLLGESGGLFARIVVADGHAAVVAERAAANPPPGGMLPPQDTSLSGPMNELAEVALHFTALRNTDLGRCGLDFWYSALAQHLGALAEEEDPFDEEAAAAPALQRRGGGEDSWVQARSVDQERLRRAEETPFLAPHIQNMVKAHWRAVRYPAEPEKEDHFEWDDFVRFRETCSINITEACVVVTPRWIIDHVGAVLEEICARPPIAWQDIDACVFVLTGVASRAPAGQDTVIPRLIELLPQLPYPTDGFKAMLLRCAASRLVLFTSGYLALQMEPCKQILRFLTMHHLPAIPALTSSPDPEAKKYCEAIACDAVKMVMTAARKAIVAADEGTFWKEIVSAVINLVSDARYNVDCRAQLVFGIGQVLSVLEDWAELEHFLGMFVQRMQEPMKPILDKLPAEPLGPRAVKLTRDGKAPLELKLYIASASSVYNIPARRPENRPEHHPVLRVVERHFPMIERVCIHHTQYEDLMEQVCLAFSYILGYAREYAPASPVFVPMMKLMARCCEYHPQPFYLGLVRQMVGFFAPVNDPQLDSVLVDMTGLFISPIAIRLGTAFNGGGATVQPLAPPLNTAAYEMLTETLRHWNLALLAIGQAQWMTETLDCTLEALPRLAEDNQAVHEKTVTAMLRFIRNVLLWADRETFKPQTATVELNEVQRLAQGLIAERALPRGPALPRLVDAVVRLLVAAAPNGPAKSEVVPSVADVLRNLLTGPFEYPTSAQLPHTFRKLPKPLLETLTEPDQNRLIQQLKMEKGDSRRFVRTVIGLAEQFAVSLKKAQFSGQN